MIDCYPFGLPSEDEDGSDAHRYYTLLGRVDIAERIPNAPSVPDVQHMIGGFDWDDTCLFKGSPIPYGAAIKALLRAPHLLTYSEAEAIVARFEKDCERRRKNLITDLLHSGQS